MATKSVAVDFGDGKIDIAVPAASSVAEFVDPPMLDDPEAAVRRALESPLGSAPLAELVRPRMRVAIGFDDITRPGIPARTILKGVVEQLMRAGIAERDITFICACSNHRKPTRTELANHLGAELFNRFWSHGQIVNHDCSDPNNLRYLGITEGGRYVEHNRAFLDADLMIYQGNVAPIGWRGFTGTGAVVGLASTKSIASHHSYHSIPDPNATKEAATTRPPVSVKEEMSAFLEEATGKKVFYVNAITGIGGKMAGVFAGHAQAVKAPAWEMARRCFSYPAPQADVVVIGLAEAYSFGSANNVLIAAFGATVPPRYCPEEPLLREGGVVIALSPSNGQIDHRIHPAYQEVIDLYGRLHSVRALVDFEEEFDNRPDYRMQYTHGHGYPPLHPFWLFYEMEYTLNRAGAVIMAGTSNPGAFRNLGLSTAPDFDAAWKMARKYVGPNPTTVVAPSYWSRPRLKFVVKREAGEKAIPIDGSNAMR